MDDFVPQSYLSQHSLQYKMAAVSFVEDLKKQLTCPSCKQILTDPKTLACLHSLCARCITKDQQVCSNNNQRFICPVCLNIVRNLPEGEPTKLRSSSYIKSLLELYHAMKAKDVTDGKRERMPNCASCRGKSFADLVGFCANCSGMVCTECVNAHKTIKYKNHRVIMFEEFKQEYLDIYIETQLPICEGKFHGKNGIRRIEYYCQEDGCECCICRRCFILDHRKHKILDKNEVAQQLQEAMKEDLAKLDSLPEKLEKELEHSKQNMARIENEIQVAKQKVCNAVQALIKKAKDHEETIIKALDKKLTDQQKAHAQEQSDIRQRTEQLEGFRLRCQNMIEKNACELVSIQKDLKQICQAFLESPATVPSQSTKRNVTMHYVTNYVICQSVKDMGKVVESVTDQSHCSIEALKEARYGFVNDLDYVTRNSKGDMSMATRWKRTFLWTKFRSSSFDNEKPWKLTRAMSVS